MQWKEIIDSVTEIGSFLAAVVAIIYVIRVVGEFLSWRLFFLLALYIGILVVHSLYIESLLVKLLATLMVMGLTVFSLDLGVQISPPKGEK